MRPRARTALTIATLSLAAALALPAVAGAGRGDGPRGPLRGALRQLDLTSAQKEQLKTALEAQKPRVRELRERMRADRESVKGLLAAEKKDYAAIGKAVVRVDETRQAMKAEREKGKATIESILTPEQRAQLAGYMQGLRASRRPGLAARRGGPDGPGPGGPGPDPRRLDDGPE